MAQEAVGLLPSATLTTCETSAHLLDDALVGALREALS